MKNIRSSTDQLIYKTHLELLGGKTNKKHVFLVRENHPDVT